MSVAIKKILYAADAKESALAKAQEYLQSVEVAETEAETETETDHWVFIDNGHSILLRLASA